MTQPTARRSWGGQALVEFAFALPILLAAVLGLAEGGYYVLASVSVSHATHEGARAGVLETTADRAAVRARVRDAAGPVVTLADAAITLELNGAPCDDACYQARLAGDRLKVLTTYTHAPLSSYIFDGLAPSNAESELWVEL